MEHLTASLDVGIVAAIDSVEAGEGGVGDVGQGGIVYAGLPRDLLGQVVLTSHSQGEQEPTQPSQHLLLEDQLETETKQLEPTCFISTRHKRCP